MKSLHTFSTAQLVEYSQIDPKLLAGLIRKGLMVADGAHRVGRGRARRFSYWNIFEASLAQELRQYGASYATIADMTRWLRDFDAPPSSSDPPAASSELVERWARLRAGQLGDMDASIAWHGEGSRAHLTVGYWAVTSEQLHAGTQPGDFPRGPRPSFLCIVLSHLLKAVRQRSGLGWPTSELPPMDDDFFASYCFRALAEAAQHENTDPPEDMGPYVAWLEKHEPAALKLYRDKVGALIEDLRALPEDDGQPGRDR